MNEILNINKPLGITSYDVIRQLKQLYPRQKIGHAGTLDPLADGVLICLVGKDATKRQDEFMGVTKEYVFDVLIGFETDTYDILGMVKEFNNYDSSPISNTVESMLSAFHGDLEQPVPPFSAVKVSGKQLYKWYLEGKIDEVDIPVKTINIESIELVESYTLDKSSLEDKVRNLVKKVRSGFRQQDILIKWDEVFAGMADQKFVICRIKAVVSKGTYVRAIAHEIGQRLGFGACTLFITRTRVGDMKLEDSVEVENLGS